MARLARVAEVRTEHLLTELLIAQGWDVRRPPNGELLRQQEYKDYPHLLDAFRGRSKKGGGGDALPEGVLVDRATMQPIAVIEAKAAVGDLDIAIAEVTNEYGRACLDVGYSPLTIAVAGTSEDDFLVRVFRWSGCKWQEATYDGNPINWIPNRADAERLRVASASPELRPSVPPPEVLAARAEEINRLLREAKIKDEFRPSIVAAIMLALWKSRGQIRKEPEHILGDLNRACAEAFRKAEKDDLANSLIIDEANIALAVKARRIVAILERLNVTVLTAEHDYLGQLYETFFRYTGGNTIGQFFTPRHITSFMANLCEAGPNDIILDPACGTGGFLISAMNRMQQKGKLSREQVISCVQKQLIGFDSEPQTAALCVANMILRGDGTTGINKGDCFTSSNFPKGKASIVLMNPPFPHKKTDRPSTDFIDRGLEALENRGLLASVVPYSLLVQTKEWHANILKNHSLVSVFTLPPDLFNPYASYNTAVLVIQKGVPHFAKHVFLGRLANDGFKLKKNMRVPREGSQMDALLKAMEGKKSINNLCAYVPISAKSSEWSPETYIAGSPPSEEEFVYGFEESVRQQAAFYIQFGHRLLSVFSSEVDSSPMHTSCVFSKHGKMDLGGMDMRPFVVGDYFDIKLGGKDEIEDLEDGDIPFVSTSEFTNGIKSWKNSNTVFSAPSITVATDGSVCSSFVQECPFYAFYKVAILTPKKAISPDALYFVAYLLNRERWRYVYARKFGKARIIQTTLFMPAKEGKPDFDIMAKWAQQTSAFPLIQEFRRLLATAGNRERL